MTVQDGGQGAGNKREQRVESTGDGDIETYRHQKLMALEEARSAMEDRKRGLREKVQKEQLTNADIAECDARIHAHNAGFRELYAVLDFSMDSDE